VIDALLATIDKADRRLAVARRLVEAQKATAICHVKGDCCPSRAVEQATKEAECAFAEKDYARAEHLAEVVLCMARRDAARFQANPEAGVARLRSVQ
jgi:multidrug resistance efflux pump